jgi:hypothetical protein
VAFAKTIGVRWCGHQRTESIEAAKKGLIGSLPIPSEMKRRKGQIDIPPCSSELVLMRGGIPPPAHHFKREAVTEGQGLS